jgi:hypothetical protein
LKVENNKETVACIEIFGNHVSQADDGNYGMEVVSEEEWNQNFRNIM